MYRPVSILLTVSIVFGAHSIAAQDLPAFGWIQQIHGSSSDSVVGVGTDSSGNVYIAGNTASPDFPVKSAFQAHSASSGLYRIDSPAAGAFAPLALNAARAIAVDPQNPQILYASSNGVLVRSLDGESTWSAVASAPPAVSTIAIDPSNHLILYVGSNGLGVFKSTDSGATWVATNSGIQPANNIAGQYFAYQFWIDPNNSNVVFVNASTGGYRSADGGATWKLDTNLAFLTSFWFDLATPGLIYATSSAKVLKSADEGQTWTALGNIPGGLTENTGDLVSITSDPKQPGRLILSTSINIFESTDDGATFVQRLSLPRGETDLGITPDWANGALYAQSSGVKRISTDLKTVTTVGPPALPPVNQIVVVHGRVYAAMDASRDIFVTKFDALGNIVYSTFFGGTADDNATAMSVDPSGNVYVTGTTGSGDFPITTGAYASSPPVAGRGASFVFKLNPAGSIAYSTYYSDYQSTPSAIAVNAAGEAFVAGTTSGNLPVTSGVFQPAFTGSGICAFSQPAVALHPNVCIFPVDGFAARFDSQGSSLMFSTYVGSFTQFSVDALAMSIAADGSLFLAAGNNLYHLNSSGTSLLSSATAPGPVLAMAAAQDGNIYVAGQVNSTTPFASSPDAFQPAPVVPLLPDQADGVYPFVTKYDPSFKQVIASTLLGGGYGAQVNGIAIDSSGNILVGGATAPLGHPTSAPLASSFSSVAGIINPSGSGFLSLLSADLTTLVFSTYLGDAEIFSVQGTAIDADGDFVIAGNTGNPNAATGPPSRIILNKISIGGRLALRVDSIVNAASLLNTPLSTGETILVRGNGFGSDAQLSIGGVTVPPLAVDSRTLTAVIPATIPVGAALVQVQSGGAMSNYVAVPIATIGPGLFSADGSGVGQGYILNADGTRNSPTNPAKTGDRITIFATGVGPLAFVGPYAVAQFTPEVYVDGFYCNGVAATVGPVSGLPGAVYQLTVTIPDPSVSFPDLKNYKYPPLAPVILKSNGVATQIGLAISMAR